MEFDMRAFLFEEIGIEEPRIRRQRLFHKLLRLVERHGLAVVQIIGECWDEATTMCKRSTPTRMFCSIVKTRLIEARLWHEERPYRTMTMQEILESGIFKRKAPMPLFEPDGQGKPAPRPGHHPKCVSPKCAGCD